MGRGPGSTFGKEGFVRGCKCRICNQHFELLWLKTCMYVDLWLPFGLSESPFIFNLSIDGPHWILKHAFND
jgi:hypothetical protein